MRPQIRQKEQNKRVTLPARGERNKPRAGYFYKEGENMEIHLMITNSDPRTLSKNLTNVAVTNADPFGELDIDNPVLRLKPFTGFASVNCFYIPDYLRYYAITKCKRLSGNIIEIYGQIDVLTTFNQAIRNSRGVCIANENIGSSHIADPNFPVDLRKNTTVYEFEGDPFNIETASDNSYNFVLNVAGGGQNEPEPEPSDE